MFILGVGNTTATSLKKYSSMEQHNSTIRTSSFVEHRNKATENDPALDEDATSFR